LLMAWSPPADNRRIVWVSAPGDYATFNSNQTPDGTLAGGSRSCTIKLRAAAQLALLLGMGRLAWTSLRTCAEPPNSIM
jgi:hypothetical protein